MLALADIATQHSTPRLVVMTGRRDPELLVDSYEGACQLLAALMAPQSELRDLVVERFKGAPTVAAFSVAADILQQVHRAHRAERRAARLQSAKRAESGTKVCTKCGAEKKLEEFNRSSHCASGRRPECRACHSAHERARYAALRGAQKEVQR